MREAAWGGIFHSTTPNSSLFISSLYFPKKRSLDLKKRSLDLKKALGVEGVEEVGSKKEGEARQMKTRIKKNQSQGYRKGRCLSTTLNFVKFWSVLVSHSACACPHPRARHRWVHGWVKHWHIFTVHAIIKKNVQGPKRRKNNPKPLFFFFFFPAGGIFFNNSDEGKFVSN